MGTATSYLLCIFTSWMVFVKSTLTKVFFGNTAVTKDLDPRSKTDQVGLHFVIATHNTHLFKSLKSYEISDKVKVGDVLLVDSRPRRSHGYLMHLLVSPPLPSCGVRTRSGWGGVGGNRPNRYTYVWGPREEGNRSRMCA